MHAIVPSRPSFRKAQSRADRLSRFSFRGIVHTLQRYRFADFVLSPKQRVLTHGGAELPLIPRYFDLLVFLVEHRAEAVHRRDIFDRVWPDVIVSDSALSQAIRTLRRTLGDDSRDSIFIRTVSRHGYRFVGSVIEEEDDTVAAAGRGRPLAEPTPADNADPFEPLLQRLVTPPASPAEQEERRDAAERLHALGTAEALRRLGLRPGHARARALLRDARWDVAGAGDVPLLHQPGGLRAAAALVGLRLRRMARLAASRATSSALGGGAAGCLAGIIGGLVLVAAPGSQASLPVAVVLAAVGTACGAVGGAGVGGGVAGAEVVARSRRVLRLFAGGALGGGGVGWATEWLGHSMLSALVGVHVSIGGGLEGIVLGAAAGLAYAVATRQADGGLAAPRGRARLATVLATAVGCAIAALALTLAGRALVGGTIHAIAKASAGSQATLTPIGRLIGDPGFGPVTRAIIGTGEGLVFGLGLALGLTRRPA